MDAYADGVGHDAPLFGREGIFANSIYLGQSTNALGDVGLLQVPSTIYLAPAMPDPQLVVRVNNINRVDTVWMEVKTPNAQAQLALDAYGQVDPYMQVVPALIPVVASPYNQPESYIWQDYYSFVSFDQAGRYDVLFYVKDSISGNISSPKRMTIYRMTAGNQTPTNFDLHAPIQGAVVNSSTTLLDWYSSTDPEGGDISYNITISPDTNFITTKAVVSNLNNAYLLADASLAFDDGSNGLQDLTTYYWKVEAVDPYGAVTPANSFGSFSVNNANFGGGNVSVKLTFNNTNLVGANVTATHIGSTTPDSSKEFFSGMYYFISLQPNISYTGKATLNGYKDKYFTFTPPTLSDALQIVVIMTPIVIPDTTRPVITILGANTITIAHGGTFTDLGTKVTDDVNNGLVATATGTVNTNVVGRYTIRYNVNDSAGNAAITKTRTVYVTDQNLPIIVNAPSNITVAATNSNGTAATQGTIAAFLNAVTATDNVGVVGIINNAPVTFPIGITTVTFTANDAAGNTDKVTANVTITITIPDSDGD
ncbi:MAG: DUF5011 domain-containing protein, partial [Mariprofundales bacterium]